MPESDPARARTLSRERIVAAAIGIIRRHGVEGLSMRRLAREMDAAPMSLYRHVKDKDELLTFVIDQIAMSLQAPSEANTWQDQVIESFCEIRRVLLAHPGVADRVAVKPPPTPAVKQVLDRIGEALHAGGFRDDEALAAFDTLWYLVLGMVLVDEAHMRAFGSAHAHAPAKDNLEFVHAVLLTDVPAPEREETAERPLARQRPDALFGEAVRAMLVGLAVLHGGDTAQRSPQ